MDYFITKKKSIRYATRFRGPKISPFFRVIKQFWYNSYLHRLIHIQGYMNNLLIDPNMNFRVCLEDIVTLQIRTCYYRTNLPVSQDLYYKDKNHQQPITAPEQLKSPTGCQPGH